MSSQQFPPTSDPSSPFGGPPPVVHQPAVPFSTPNPVGGRRKGRIALGALILAAGVAAGIVMIAAAGKNYDEGVQKLARAPIGCTTALRFDDTGTFTVYVETVGSIGEVRGDCPGTGSDYSYRHDDLPNVDLVLTDADGNEIDLNDDTGKDYDAAGFTGQSIASVVIDEAGDYDLTVTSDDSNFAISVGKNPKKSADTLRGGGGLAFIAGVVIGGLLFLLGLRRRKPGTAPLAPVGAPPQSFTPSQQWAPAPPNTGWPPAAPAPPVAPAVPPNSPPPGTPPSTPPPGTPPPLSPPNWPAPPTS